MMVVRASTKRSASCDCISICRFQEFRDVKRTHLPLSRIGMVMEITQESAFANWPCSLFPVVPAARSNAVVEDHGHKAPVLHIWSQLVRLARPLADVRLDHPLDQHVVVRKVMVRLCDPVVGLEGETFRTPGGLVHRGLVQRSDHVAA